MYAALYNLYDLYEKVLDPEKVTLCFVQIGLSDRPNLRSNFCNHIRLDCFQRIISISKLFGTRGGGIEILTIVGMQKCQFLAKSENWTNVYVGCSCKLIIYDESLVYLHSLDVLPNKLYNSIFYRSDQQQGQFCSSWSYLFKQMHCWKYNSEHRSSLAWSKITKKKTKWNVHFISMCTGGYHLQDTFWYEKYVGCWSLSMRYEGSLFSNERGFHSATDR